MYFGYIGITEVFSHGGVIFKSNDNRGMCGIEYCFSRRAAEEAIIFLCLACFHEERTFSMYGEIFSFCLGCFPVISYGQDNMLRISDYFYIFPLLSCFYKSRPLFSFVSKQCLARCTIRTTIVSELLKLFIARVVYLTVLSLNVLTDYCCCTELFSDYDFTVCT